MAFSSNPMFSPENLLMLSGNILAAPSFGAGLGTGLSQLGSNVAAKQKEQDERMRQMQEQRQIGNFLREKMPGQDLSNYTPGMLSAAATNVLEKQLNPAKPEFKVLDDGTYGTWDGSKFNVLGRASKPAELPAEFRNFQLAQENPDFAKHLQEKDVKPGDNFKTEQELWKNWRSDADVKEYQGVRNGFEKIRASAIDPSGPKDLGIIFGYMKMLDPTSVVREGEQASVANSGGVPQQVMSLYNRVLTGEKLPEQVRADIIKAAEGLYTESAGNYEAVNEQVRNMAERYNVDPQFIAPAEKYEPIPIGKKINSTVNGKPVTIERVDD